MAIDLTGMGNVLHTLRLMYHTIIFLPLFLVKTAGSWLFLRIDPGLGLDGV